MIGSLNRAAFKNKGIEIDLFMDRTEYRLFHLMMLMETISERMRFLYMHDWDCGHHTE
jgi:hypothetical protein